MPISQYYGFRGLLSACPPSFAPGAVPVRVPAPAGSVPSGSISNGPKSPAIMYFLAWPRGNSNCPHIWWNILTNRKTTAKYLEIHCRSIFTHRGRAHRLTPAKDRGQSTATGPHHHRSLQRPPVQSYNEWILHKANNLAGNIFR